MSKSNSVIYLSNYMSHVNSKRALMVLTSKIPNHSKQSASNLGNKKPIYF